MSSFSLRNDCVDRVQTNLCSIFVPDRATGKSKYTFIKMLSLALRAAMSFSTKPIYVGIRMGLVILSSGVAYLTWILVRYLLLGGNVPGWTSLIAVMLVVGGTQLLFISLIGQYIVFLYEELKRRPLYLTKTGPPKTVPQTPERSVLAVVVGLRPFECG